MSNKTLRDKIAIEAMKADWMASCDDSAIEVRSPADITRAASVYYQMADAMLAARVEHQEAGCESESSEVMRVGDSEAIRIHLLRLAHAAWGRDKPPEARYATMDHDGYICLWAKCPNFRDGEWVPTAEGRSISGHWPSEDLRTELTPEEANEAFVYVNRDTTPVVARSGEQEADCEPEANKPTQFDDTEELREYVFQSARATWDLKVLKKARYITMDHDGLACLWAKRPAFRNGKWRSTEKGGLITSDWFFEGLDRELGYQETANTIRHVNRRQTSVVERLRDIDDSLRSQGEMPKEAEFITADRDGTWKVWDKRPVYLELNGVWKPESSTWMLLSGHEPDLANDGSVHNIIWI